MTAVLQDHYLGEFERLKRPAARRKAFEHFRDLGFPTGHEEDWRFTDVTPVTEIPFRLPDSDADAPSLLPLARGPLKNHQITFLDGRFAPELSTKDVARLTGKERPFVEKNVFATLNDAFWTDGAHVRVPKGVTLEAPLHLLFLFSNRPEAYMTHPRVVIEMEANSRAAVVESYLGPTGGVYLTNTVTEIILGENASLDYSKVQRESPEAFHFATTIIRQERGSSLVSHSIALGALLSRNEIFTTLEGEGAVTTLNGLYEATGRQRVDFHTTIDHVKPHTTSRELFKGIMNGQSRGVFDGRIIVRPDAQKTNALQMNKNLLLSKEALAHSKPQLEIFANDVKCKHGATIGQLDEDVLFYLRSRGIGYEEARRLLVHAFASEIIDQVKVEAIRIQLGGCLSMLVK